MKFAKFLRTPYFTEGHLQWLFLTVSGFQPATLLKKRFPQRCFSVNFAKFLRTSFDRAPPDDCFLSISVNFKFFRTSLLQITSEKLLISCTSCRTSTNRYSEKLFHRCFFAIDFRRVGQTVKWRSLWYIVLILHWEIFEEIPP